MANMKHVFKSKKETKTIISKQLNIMVGDTIRIGGTMQKVKDKIFIFGEKGIEYILYELV